MTDRDNEASDSRWADGTVRSRNNAFTTPQGLSWVREATSEVMKAVSTARVAKLRATKEGATTIYGTGTVSRAASKA